MEIFDNINARITANLGPAGPLLLLGFLGVLMIILVLPTLLKKKAEPFD